MPDYGDLTPLPPMPAGRRKITVRVADEWLERFERAVERADIGSRSAVLNGLIRRWTQVIEET